MDAPEPLETLSDALVELRRITEFLERSLDDDTEKDDDA